MSRDEIIKIMVDKLTQNKDAYAQDFFSKNEITDSKFFIVDDLLPKDLVIEIYNSFPDEKMFRFQDDFREKKFSFKNTDDLESPLPGIVTDCLQSQAVIDQIARITQVPNLTGDPSLYAGGLSRMDETHFLNPHIDNSHDADRSSYRRFNSLYYVTPDLTEQDGGSLELWDRQVNRAVKILSKFNRLVVMETNKTTWHSVNPVESRIKRCCVSNYYFTESSPTGHDYYHVTSFTGRPGQTGQRIYGALDNFLRQTVAAGFGVSRGKKLTR